MLHRLAVTLSVFVLATIAPVTLGADPLDAPFARIDAAAKSFKGMTADISNTQHTSLVDSDDIQNGSIKLLRVKGGTRLLIEWKGAGGNQKLSFDGREGRIYNPITNIVDVLGLADKENTVNQLLLLGFGATSTELKDTYDVTFVGEEKIGAQQTSHLKLIPKSPDTRRTLKQADMWYAENGLVAQQKFLYPSGDYRLVRYSGMKPGAMPEKELELKIPKNATVQKH